MVKLETPVSRPRLPTLLGMFALAAVLPLAACNKDKTANTTVAGNLSGGQPALPATSAAPQEQAEPADPCPSIGTVAETHGGAITAPTAARVIRLGAACSAEQMTAHLRGYGQGMRYILVADDMHGAGGAPFELKLDPPSTGEAAVIGTLTLVPLAESRRVGQPHSVSYDVSQQVAALAVSGWPAQGLGLAIAPATASASSTLSPSPNASVGALRLVAEAPR